MVHEGASGVFTAAGLESILCPAQSSMWTGVTQADCCLLALLS